MDKVGRPLGHGHWGARSPSLFSLKSLIFVVSSHFISRSLLAILPTNTSCGDRLHCPQWISVHESLLLHCERTLNRQWCRGCSLHNFLRVRSALDMVCIISLQQISSPSTYRCATLCHFSWKGSFSFSIYSVTIGLTVFHANYFRFNCSVIARFTSTGQRNPGRMTFSVKHLISVKHLKRFKSALSSLFCTLQQPTGFMYMHLQAIRNAY